MGDNGRVVELLQGIWNEIKTVNTRINTTNERLDQTNERLDRLETEVRTGFAVLGSRFDHLLEFAGDRYRDHDRRLGAIEQRIDRIEQRGAQR